jgi:hypothetical protein
MNFDKEARASLDFDGVRTAITMKQVLSLLGVQPSSGYRRSPVQIRSPRLFFKESRLMEIERLRSFAARSYNLRCGSIELRQSRDFGGDGDGI